jgi:MoxR-like ATPase
LAVTLSIEEILDVRKQVPLVRVAAPVDGYILSLVQATRSMPRVEVGVSPRGALALRKACQAYALLNNRDYVTPDDVKALSVAVLSHRLIFSSDHTAPAMAESERVINGLLQSTAVPL